MNRARTLGIAVVLLFVRTCVGAGQEVGTPDELRTESTPQSISVVRDTPSPNRPLVTLAYDGTGDFGPDTPGTTTAGWQEALDHCVSHHLDLYVMGGWGEYGDSSLR